MFLISLKSSVLGPTGRPFAHTGEPKIRQNGRAVGPKMLIHHLRPSPLGWAKQMAGTLALRAVAQSESTWQNGGLQTTSMRDNSVCDYDD